MSALDGAFGGLREQVTAKVDTGSWVTPTRTLYVRGQDSRGNWGEAAAIDVALQQMPADSWPTYGQNAARTGYQAVVTATAGYDLAWTVGSNMTGQSVGVNDIIISTQYLDFSDVRGGRVLATSAATGRQLWHHDYPEIRFISPPTVAYGQVYFQVTGYSSETKNLYALNISDGREVWHAPFEAYDYRYYAPALADGRVFAPCGLFNGLCAWDAYTGRALWTEPLLGQYDGWTPSYADGVVYSLMPTSAGDITLYLQAFDARNHHTLWTADLGRQSFGDYSLFHNTAVSGGSAFVVKANSELIAVDLASHNVKWRVSGGFIGTPAVGGGQVFALAGAELRVYDAVTGALEWSYATNQALTDQPLVTPSHVFISSAHHTWRIALETQHVDWEADHGGWLTLTGGQLLITEEGGALVTYRPR